MFGKILIANRGEIALRIVRAWRPRRVLDLATGSGDLALTLARYCPNTTLIGADFCLPMLLQGKAKGASNLLAADGLQLPFADHAFDALTIAFGLRNMKS